MLYNSYSIYSYNNFAYKIEGSPSSIGNCPNDILHLFFKKLSNKELAKAALVCRRWSLVISDICLCRKISLAIQKGLGDFQKQIQPDTGLLKELAKSILETARKSKELADLDPSKENAINKLTYKKANTLLARMQRHPDSLKNNLLSAIVSSWIEETNTKEEEVFLDLLKYIYQSYFLNNANRLYLAAISGEGEILEGYESKISSFNPERSVSIKGEKLAKESLFERREVPKDLIHTITISANNRFHVSEIVGVIHRGDLMQDHKKLWFGVVTKVKIKDSKEKYQVATQFYKGLWLDKIWATASMIGKIPPGSYICEDNKNRANKSLFMTD